MGRSSIRPSSNLPSMPRWPHRGSPRRSASRPRSGSPQERLRLRRPLPRFRSTRRSFLLRLRPRRPENKAQFHARCGMWIDCAKSASPVEKKGVFPQANFVDLLSRICRIRCSEDRDTRVRLFFEPTHLTTATQVAVPHEFPSASNETRVTVRSPLVLPVWCGRGAKSAERVRGS